MKNKPVQIQTKATRTKAIQTKAGAAACLLYLTGCRRAQSYNLLGSYFPAWLLCIVIGIVLASLIYLLLERLDLAEQLSPPLLIYTALTVVLTLGLWLALYS